MKGLAAGGDELSQIADHLCISPHTVRVHTKKIYTKLQVNSRSHAIYQALQKNLMRSPQQTRSSAARVGIAQRGRHHVQAHYTQAPLTE